MSFNGPMMALVGVLLLTVVGLAFGSEIITAAQEAVGHQYVANFIGLATIAKVIPTMYYLGLLSIAGGVGFVSVKKLINDRGS